MLLYTTTLLDSVQWKHCHLGGMGSSNLIATIGRREVYLCA